MTRIFLFDTKAQELTIKYASVRCETGGCFFTEYFPSGTKREAICKDRGRILLGQCRKGGRKCLRRFLIKQARDSLSRARSFQNIFERFFGSLFHDLSSIGINKVPSPDKVAPNEVEPFSSFWQPIRSPLLSCIFPITSA